MFKTIGRGLNSASAAIGRRTATGKVGGQIASRSASRAFKGMNASAPVGMRGSAATRLQAKRAATTAAARSAHVQAGKKHLMIAGGAGVMGASLAMRPNADQSRTAYRGPMQTGRGVGRYA